MNPQWWMLGGCLVLGFLLGSKYRQNQVQNLKQVIRYLIDAVGSLRDELDIYREEGEKVRTKNGHRIIDPKLGR